MEWTSSKSLGGGGEEVAGGPQRHLWGTYWRCRYVVHYILGHILHDVFDGLRYVVSRDAGNWALGDGISEEQYLARI